MEYKSFDTEDAVGREETFSVASWDDLTKLTVIDNDGYYQETYMNYETVRSIRDHLTSILESPKKGEKAND